MQTGIRLDNGFSSQAGQNSVEEFQWNGRPFREPDGKEYRHSHVFEVFNAPVVVRAMRIPGDAKLYVQMVAGCKGGDVFEDLWIRCEPVTLHKKNNLVVLPVDGRYRLRLCGCTPEEIVVVQHATGIPFDYGSLLK